MTVVAKKLEAVSAKRDGSSKKAKIKKTVVAKNISMVGAKNIYGGSKI